MSRHNHHKKIKNPSWKWFYKHKFYLIKSVDTFQTFSKFCSPSGDALLKGNAGSLDFPGIIGEKGKSVQSSYSVPEHLAWHLFGKTVGFSLSETFEQTGVKIMLHFFSHLSQEPFTGLSRLIISSELEQRASHRL